MKKTLALAAVAFLLFGGYAYNSGMDAAAAAPTPSPQVIQLPAPSPQVIQLPAPSPQVIQLPAPSPQVIQLPAPSPTVVEKRVEVKVAVPVTPEACISAITAADDALTNLGDWINAMADEDYDTADKLSNQTEGLLHTYIETRQACLDTPTSD